jgi:two-component system chemotaxis response regulator CheB
VVGVAHDGQEAVAMARETCPHVLISDYEMPGWTIPETLRELHKEQPDVKVLMFSQHTSRGAEATMDALLAGASIYLPKPVGSTSAEAAKAYMTANLVPKLGPCSPPLPPGPISSLSKRPSRPTRRPGRGGGFHGGPEALSRFIANLPSNSPSRCWWSSICRPISPSFCRASQGALSSECARSRPRRAPPSQYHPDRPR